MVTEAGRRPELREGERKEGYWGEAVLNATSVSPVEKNEREAGLSLFKMHKAAEHPTVAWLLHHSKCQAQGKPSGSS